MTHRTSLTVRMFEIDAQGHLAGSAYVDYANQAFWEKLRTAGIDIDALIASGIGPVILETNIKYRRELKAGDDVEIECNLHFKPGKTFLTQCIFHRSDGHVAAELESVCGLLDLSQRSLLADPAARWRAVATRPEAIGL